MKRLIVMLTLMLCLSGCGTAETIEPSFVCNTEVFEIETGDFDPRYNAVVSVTHTGDTFLDIGYTAFDVEKSDGTLIATENSSAIGSQPSVIAPGETGYYYAGRISLPNTFDPTGEYVLKFDTSTVKVLPGKEVADLEVKDVSIVDGDYGEVIGKVVNSTDREMDIDVTIVCYGEQGNIVTVGGTIVQSRSGEETAFDIYNLAALGRTDIVRYEIKAREIVY